MIDKDLKENILERKQCQKEEEIFQRDKKNKVIKEFFFMTKRLEKIEKQKREKENSLYYFISIMTSNLIYILPRF